MPPFLFTLCCIYNCIAVRGPLSRACIYNCLSRRIAGHVPLSSRARETVYTIVCTYISGTCPAITRDCMDRRMYIQTKLQDRTYIQKTLQDRTYIQTSVDTNVIGNGVKCPNRICSNSYRKKMWPIAKTLFTSGGKSATPVPLKRKRKRMKTRKIGGLRFIWLGRLIITLSWSKKRDKS